MKNLILSSVVGFGILWGSVGLAQTNAAPNNVPNTSTAVENIIVRHHRPLRCDEPRIRTCNTDCVRRCVRGPG